jgi:hypothetical protein
VYVFGTGNLVVLILLILSPFTCGSREMFPFPQELIWLCYVAHEVKSYLESGFASRDIYLLCICYTSSAQQPLVGPLI